MMVSLFYRNTSIIFRVLLRVQFPPWFIFAYRKRYLLGNVHLNINQHARILIKKARESEHYVFTSTVIPQREIQHPFDRFSADTVCKLLLCSLWGSSLSINAFLAGFSGLLLTSCFKTIVWLIVTENASMHPDKSFLS